MNEFFELSAQVVRFLQNLIGGPLWMGFWLFMSYALLGAAMLSILFFYVCVDRRSGYYFIISFLSAAAFESLLKGLVREPRPFVGHGGIANGDPLTAIGYSFPSGHCVSVACSVSVFFGYYRSILSYYMTFFWIVNSLMMVSRMVLGCHYPHDCLAGFAVGVAVGYFVLQLIRSYQVFFNRHCYLAGGLTAAIGAVGAIMGRFGVEFFALNANAFHVLTAIGCVTIGDHLERKLIGCVCHARNLKKLIRLLFFVVTSGLICAGYLMYFKRTIFTMHVLVVIMSFYCTLGFSWLGSVMMLFEKQN